MWQQHASDLKAFLINPSALLTLFLLNLLLANTAVSALPVQGLFTPQEQQWLSQHPVLRIAVKPGELPYEGVDQFGRYQGINADYTHLVAQKLGVEIEVVAAPGDTSPETLVKAGKADIAALLGTDNHLNNSLPVTEPFYKSSLGIITRREHTSLSSQHDFAGKRLALAQPYDNFSLLEARYPGISLVPVDSVEEALKAVASGRVDGAESDLAVASYFIQKFRLNNLVIGDARELGLARINYAVRSDWPELIAMLDKTLTSITVQQHFKIQQKWEGLAQLQPASERLELTAQEQRWLQNHPLIRLGVDPAFAPFEWLNEQGEYTGLAADYMALLARRLGVQFDVIPGLSWDEVAQKGRAKELDVLPLLTATEQRKKNYLFTRSYVHDPYVIIGRDNQPQIASEADLAGKKVALIKEYSATELLLKHQPDVIPVYVDSELDSLLAVVSGDADFTVGHLGTLAFKIRQNHLANLNVIARTRFETQGLSIAVRDDWPMLRDLLDRALDSITTQEHQQINQRWLQVADVFNTVTVDLNAEEKQWLLEHPVIKVANDPAWEPLEYVDENGEFRGLSRDYLNELEKLLGVTFESAKNMSWQQMVDKVKGRELDMFSAVAETPERATYVDFTGEYFSQPIMIFAGSEVAYINDLQQLAGRRVAVVENYAVHDLLVQDYPSIELVAAPSLSDALRLLAAGEVEAFVGSIVTTTYYLNELGLTQIKVAGETPYRHGLVMAVRKDWSILTGIIDKALRAMPPDVHHQIQQRWMPINFKVEQDYSWLWKPMAVLTLVIALVIYWNRRLMLEVAARKQTEQALIEQQQRLDDVFQVTPSGIWDWDIKADEIYCSPAYFDILGYQPEDFETTDVNSIWLNLVHPDDKAKILTVHKTSANSDELFSEEYRIRCKDGSYKWILDRGLVVARNEAGEPTRMVGSYVDIDGLKRLESQLRDAKEAAEAANLAKSTFLANMSHELRTPLNAVLGFSNLMEHDKTTTPDQKESLRMINASGRHLLGLINEVLDMSKVEAGHATLEVELADLHQLLVDVASMMKARASSKELDFHLVRQPSVPQYVSVDSGKLKQILINLLGNAIKFTDSGMVELSVKAATLSQDKWCLSFAVKDTGIGIAREHQSTIFEPFIQARQGENQQKGTGLGLAISQQFTRLMGGDLRLESEPGEGTVFYFEIEVQLGDVCVVAAEEQQQAITGVAEGEPEWRILVVEDQPSSRALLQSQLKAAGFSVQVAVDGQQGIDLFLSWQPHLVWMDMRMPVMSGFQAVRRIRELPGGKEVKILAITASVLRDQAADIIAAGCDEVYYKPCLEQDVLTAMASQLPINFSYRCDQPDELERGEREQQTIDLSSLPEPLVKQMLAVAKMGDVAELELMVSRLSDAEQPVKRQLEHYIQGFQIQEMIEALQQVA